jgi:beta-glucosidase
MTQSRFPKDFLWGVSTAAYQIEGAVQAGGRGPSIWDVFSHTPGKVLHGDTGDVACDHYNRLEDDLDLLQALGVQVYRFSIAWPRIQPSGSGAANPEGLAFYDRLIDGLLARGITPVPTLYHWDLPQALQDEGGWAWRGIVERFVAYADILYRAFGDRVKIWTTINEPWVAAYFGYAIGIHAPGLSDPAAAAAAHHHMLLAHAAAADLGRQLIAGAKVGIALVLMQIYATSEHPDDVAASTLADAHLNAAFLQPLFAHGYPQVLTDAQDYREEGAGIVRPGIWRPSAVGPISSA